MITHACQGTVEPVVIGLPKELFKSTVEPIVIGLPKELFKSTVELIVIGLPIHDKYLL